MIPLPNKSLSILALACAAAFVVYVALMVTAIYFASSATELAGIARAKEADVVALETRYYDAIREITKTDPAALGFVTPTEVNYVAATGFPAFSRADR